MFTIFHTANSVCRMHVETGVACRLLNDGSWEAIKEPEQIAAPPPKLCPFYGPHECDECGAMIVRASLESGGRKFDVPERLLRVFMRGSEAGDPEISYPQAWAQHVCSPERISSLPTAAPASTCETSAHPMYQPMEVARVRAYRAARIHEPNDDMYRAAMSVYAAAFGEHPGEAQDRLDSRLVVNRSDYAVIRRGSGSIQQFGAITVSEDRLG